MFERKIDFMVNTTTKKRIVKDEYGVFSVLYKARPNGRFYFDRIMVQDDHSETGIEGDWVVTVYNSLDAEFGYDCGATIIYNHLSKAAAKSIERNLNRRSPEFISYDCESEKSFYDRQRLAYR